MPLAARAVEQARAAGNQAEALRMIDRRRADVFS